MLHRAGGGRSGQFYSPEGESSLGEERARFEALDVGRFWFAGVFPPRVVAGSSATLPGEGEGESVCCPVSMGTDVFAESFARSGRSHAGIVMLTLVRVGDFGDARRRPG